LSTKEQLVYQGGFNTLGFGCGLLALLVVDRFSRPLLIAGGTAIVLATLVAEAALVASYPPVPGTSPTGLKGALAMIYLYIVSFLNAVSLNEPNRLLGLRRISPRWHPVHLLQRSVAQPPSCEGNDHRNGYHRFGEYNVASSSSDCFRVSIAPNLEVSRLITC